MEYLTFDTYKELGGKIEDESTFKYLVQRAKRKVDFITNGSLVNATIIPDEVKELMTLYVDMIQSESESNSHVNSSLTTYSNGVESFTYGNKTSDEIKKQYIDLAYEYLANTGLLYRGGVKFEYI